MIIRAGGLGAVAAGLVAAAAAGQPCPPVIGPGHVHLPLSSGVSGRITDVTVDQTGPEPSLIVAGWVDVIDARGEVASSIVRWDGAAWSAVGDGLAGVEDLAAFDGHIYAANRASIFRLQAGEWVKMTGISIGVVGTPGFHILDTGAGPALYVTGALTVGDTETPAAVWTGSAWESVGAATGEVNSLRDLVALDGDLFGLSSSRLARLDGDQWRLEGAVPVGVDAIGVFDDGSGAEIYIGSDRLGAAGRFDGESFSPDPELLDVSVLAPQPGPGVLRAMRQDEPGRHTLRQFDGAAWSTVAEVTASVDDRPRLADLSTLASPDALAVFSATGTVNGEPMRQIITYSDGAWRPLGEHAPPRVFAMETGDANWLAVDTIIPGGSVGMQLAVDDGTGLRPAGAVAGTVRTIRTLMLDGERQTFVGGPQAIDGEPLRGVARWTGAGFEQFGEPLSAGLVVVQALELFDAGAGAELYAAGQFDRRDPMLYNIARWTGSAWVDVGGGIDGPYVSALASFDDGAGPVLFAGGRFDRAGDVDAYGLARWDGDAWSTEPGDPQGLVNEMHVVEIEGKPVLVAAGAFRLPLGAEPEKNYVLATYDGDRWRPLGDSYELLEVGYGYEKSPIFAMTPLVVDDRLMVYISGDFNLYIASVGYVSLSALFDGERWHEIEPDGARAIASAASPDGRSIVVGGAFVGFEGVVQPGLATITPCTCPADLDGDGELSFFDFLAFQNLFAAGDLRADFDEDGELTFFDFLAFQNEFAAGCA